MRPAYRIESQGERPFLGKKRHPVRTVGMTTET